MDDFIQIEGISKKYDNKYVIKDVSMSIPSGRIIGLLGDNGIGKTTLLKLMGALVLKSIVLPLYCVTYVQQHNIILSFSKP